MRSRMALENAQYVILQQSVFEYNKKFTFLFWKAAGKRLLPLGSKSGYEAKAHKEL